ncbi:hypothetical protein D8S78_14150 [Natrialba swarupiae]|nr:hypothetical protein [Natrialba swarupiae]
MTAVNRYRVVLAVGGAVAANLAVLALALMTVGAGGFDPFAVPPVAIASAVGAIGVSSSTKASSVHLEMQPTVGSLSWPFS